MKTTMHSSSIGNNLRLSAFIRGYFVKKGFTALGGMLTLLAHESMPPRLNTSI